MILPPPLAKDKEAAINSLRKAGRLRRVGHPFVVEVNAAPLDSAPGVGLRAGQATRDEQIDHRQAVTCLLYTSPSPRD